MNATATNRKGSSCVNGTRPGEAVMFGFTVNPVCGMVSPVVAFAVGPMRDPTKKMMMAMKKISPMREAFLILVCGKPISPKE